MTPVLMLKKVSPVVAFAGKMSDRSCELKLLYHLLECLKPISLIRLGVNEKKIKLTHY